MTTRSLTALGAFALALVACGNDYDHVDIPPNAVVSSFAGGSDNASDSVTESHITITEGHVVKAHIAVYDDDNKTMGLVVKTENEGVIDVRYVTTPDDFAFFATSVGHTAIQLIADGNLILTINADVVPQPSP